MRSIHNMRRLRPKERRYRRFDLQLPVCLNFYSAGVAPKLKFRRNVSIGGLLLTTAERIPPHTTVSVTMEVPTHSPGRSVRLLGDGEAARVKPLGSNAGFGIALKCRQPIAEMEDHLGAAS